MRRLTFLPLLLPILLLVPATARAATMTFAFSGTISCLGATCADPLGLVGDPFTGTLTVDLSVVDSNGNSQIGQYDNAVTNLLLETGTLDLTATGGSVTIWDDYCSFAACPGSGPYLDKYEVPDFTGDGDNSAAYDFGIQLVLLQEPSAGTPILMVTGDTLNQTPVVAAWVNSRYFQVNYWPATAGSCIAAGSTCGKLKFNLENLTVVPEPATLLLLGLGLGAVAAHQRRRGRRTRV